MRARYDRSVQVAAAIAIGLAVVELAAAADALTSAFSRGKAAYESGRYEEALKTFEAAAEPEDAALRADLWHNRAATLFKLGRIDDARELWVRAAALKDARFEAVVRFNLGNCDYAAALSAAEGASAARALTLIEKAINSYRDALRLDPQLADARANLELAMQFKNTFSKEETSQPASNPEKSQQPDPSASQPSSEQTDPNRQGDEEGETNQNPTSQPDGEPHSQPATQSADGPPQSQPSPQPQPEEDPGEDPSNPSDQPEPPPASQATSQPAEQQQAGQPRPVYMTPEEAERLLQRVRDLEKARREALMRREAMRHRPVERDW